MTALPLRTVPTLPLLGRLRRRATPDGRYTSATSTGRRAGPDLLFPDCAPSSVRPSASQRALLGASVSR